MSMDPAPFDRTIEIDVDGMTDASERVAELG